MLKQYHIEKVYSSNTKKDGTPLTGKDGKPFTKYSVLVADEWLELKGWGKEDVKSGDIIEAELQEKQGEGKWAGTVFKSLYIPKPDPSKDIAELKDLIDDLTSRVEIIEQKVFGAQETPPELDPEDIPF